MAMGKINFVKEVSLQNKEESVNMREILEGVLVQLKKEFKQEAALRMIRDKVLTLENIAEYTGLSLEEVDDLYVRDIVIKSWATL